MERFFIIKLEVERLKNKQTWSGAFKKNKTWSGAV